MLQKPPNFAAAFGKLANEFFSKVIVACTTLA
jgi:hypothetical protein